MSNGELTKDLLISFFTDGCKHKKKWRIGTEHEKFGFNKKTLEPIKYQDIEKILKKLSIKFGWKKSLKKKIIGLKKNNSSISLEW